MTRTQSRFFILMQQMADHTAPECASCRAPHSCCDPMYCEMAIEEARDHWGVTLVPTGHPELPLMGASGCIAAPHFRPICTVHTCAINGFGFKPGDEAWTKKYFQLRDRIERYVPLP